MPPVTSPVTVSVTLMLEPSAATKLQVPLAAEPVTVMFAAASAFLVALLPPASVVDVLRR
jgi:hypothetical protein